MAQIMDGPAMGRALVRIAHEIVERNGGGGGVTLLGVRRRGVPLAHRIAQSIATIEGEGPPVGSIDIGLYRDDLSSRPFPSIEKSQMGISLDGRTVVLVDDVLYTGRTVHAALDAMADYGRPEVVQLAVLVDRGHRELPIRPDFIGKNVPTSRREEIRVLVAEVDGVDGVWLEKPSDDSTSDDGRGE